MKTCETPSTDVERSSSMPEIVLTAPSTWSVISVSISCGGAGIHDGYRDGRQVDLRKEIDTQRLVRKQPDYSQTENQHRRKNRTANTYFSEFLHMT